jgi:hypothetical protein
MIIILPLKLPPEAPAETTQTEQGYKNAS